MSSRNTIVIGIGAVAAVGALVYALLIKKGGNSEDALPALTEAETEEVMEALSKKTGPLRQQMLNTTEMIKQKFAAQGQQADDAQLREHLILPKFREGYEALVSEVLGDFDIDEEELEDAVTYYSAPSSSSSGNVAALTESIKACYVSLGGQVGPSTQVTAMGASETATTGEMALEDVLTVLQTLSTVLNEKTEEYIVAYKAQNGVPADPESMNRFQMGAAQLSEAAEANVLSSFGLTANQFRDALMMYKDRQEIMMPMMMIQQQSQQMLMRHGMMPPQMM